MSGFLINPYMYHPAVTVGNPYLLYDTRTWTGGDIENTAPGGPDWPLTVLTGVDRGVTYQYAAHQEVAGFDASVIGGAPTSAPFTFVAGLGPLALVDDGTPGGDLSELANGHNARFETIGYTTTCWVFGNRSGETASAHYGEIETDDLLIRVQSSGANSRSMRVKPAWEPFVGAPGGNVVAEPGLAGRVVIGCLDVVNSANNAGWIDGVAVPLSTGSPTLDHYTEASSGTLAAFNPATSWIGRLMNLGTNYPEATTGKWESGAYAMGLYRGVPTAEDVADLTAFYAA
jgi:hypothetical protein